MPDLSAFQDAFSEALGGDPAALMPWLDGIDADERLGVYRNTTRKGLIDAVVAAYPTVEQVVGSEWLSAAADLFVQAHPPVRASLALYGEAFPVWLAAFEPAADLPYLPPLAQLDRLWLEAHLAADAPALDIAAVASLDLDDLARTAAVPHPGARLAWFDANVPSLWLAHRPDVEPPAGFEIQEQGEGLLLTRPDGAVRSRLLDLPTYAFASACCGGMSLAAAAERALAHAAAADLGAIVSTCLGEGLFTALTPIGNPEGGAS